MLEKTNIYIYIYIYIDIYIVCMQAAQCEGGKGMLYI
jgi:hypothetical protein